MIGIQVETRSDSLGMEMEREEWKRVRTEWSRYRHVMTCGRLENW